MTDAALAALRVWAIQVELGGRLFTIPALPAAEWFTAVLSGELFPIVPGLFVAEDEEELMDMLLDGEVTPTEIDRANRDALAEASGWKWWEAERLIVSAAAEWRVIGGILVAAGIRPDQASLGAVLSALYALAVQNMKPADRFSFDTQLSMPPVGQVEPGEWFDESAYEDAYADLLREQGDKPLP